VHHKSFRRYRPFFFAASLFLLTFVSTGTAQVQAPDSGIISTPKHADHADSPSVPVPDKRILGVLPNYRTVQDTGDVEPIPGRRKMWIASKDTFDYPIWLLAAGFAGLYQLDNENPSFGQGVKGYFRRYGTSLADQMMGNILTEGVFPVLLHEDPRYFRRGTGSKKSRVWYAATRILVTRTDAGTNRFNFSEILGNSIAVGISNAYYPQDRDVTDNVKKLGLQFGTDAFSNVLKEFWPDIKQKFFAKHRDPQP
jgi:hypothetical protein